MKAERSIKDVDIIWDTRDYPDEYYAEVMDTLVYPN